MADAFEPTLYSPLSDRQGPDAGVDMSERPYLGKVNLRGNPDDSVFRSAVEGRLGLEIPVTANTFTSNETNAVYWLGPDEWLIHCPRDDRHELLDGLRDSVTGTHCAVTDVSDYYLVIRLCGGKAREVLSKGTPFDVHQSAFGPGACAQTCFGHASILLGCVDDTPTFDLQVRWSFAEYVWRFLVESTREYEGF